jgi:hypothetical protein
MGLFAIYIFERINNLTKDPEFRIAIKRMYSSLGRVAKQARGVGRRL